MENVAAAPAVSVVIPLYNAEKYIAECLDSLLAQTFQNFEVIVVDDCSTDNSVAIVESYIPKFNGRLRLKKTKTNSGGGGYVPRNLGLKISRGEYVFFIDADDCILLKALDELYSLAQNYDADVVYCEKYCKADEDGTNRRIETCREGILVSKPILEPEDLKERVQRIVDERYLSTPWSKFVRRKLLIDNELFFFNLKTGGDNIWTQSLLFYAKKFLRVPNVVYIYRHSENSTQRTERTPQQAINFRLNPVLLGLKILDNFMSNHEFFKSNPACRYALLKKFINKRFAWTLKYARTITEDIIYSTIKDEFGDKLGEYDVLIPALCAALYGEKKSRSDDAEELIEFKNKFTARIDVKLVTGDAGGDLQILSVSDDKAEVLQPEWLNKDGVAYLIRSYSGQVKLVAKTDADGQIQLGLRGLNVPNPADKNKSIRYWIYYTSLKINGKAVFNEITPARYGKAYIHDMDVKAGEEITMEIEWLS